MLTFVVKYLATLPTLVKQNQLKNNNKVSEQLSVELWITFE
jgi:hypothetical protein